jgi:hypothetical protein
MKIEGRRGSWETILSSKELFFLHLARDKEVTPVAH